VGNELKYVVISRCSRENSVPRLLIVKLAWTGLVHTRGFSLLKLRRFSTYVLVFPLHLLVVQDKKKAPHTQAIEMISDVLFCRNLIIEYNLGGYSQSNCISAQILARAPAHTCSCTPGLLPTLHLVL
jgi:hypothetical protein